MAWENFSFREVIGKSEGWSIQLWNERSKVLLERSLENAVEVGLIESFVDCGLAILVFLGLKDEARDVLQEWEFEWELVGFE